MEADPVVPSDAGAGDRRRMWASAAADGRARRRPPVRRQPPRPARRAAKQLRKAKATDGSRRRPPDARRLAVRGDGGERARSGIGRVDAGRLAHRPRPDGRGGGAARRRLAGGGRGRDVGRSVRVPDAAPGGSGTGTPGGVASTDTGRPIPGRRRKEHDMRQRRKLLSALAVLGLGGVIATGPTGSVGASSHREAPLISQDPVADLTDVYAFNSPDGPNRHVHHGRGPVREPGGRSELLQVRRRRGCTSSTSTRTATPIADFKYQFRFNSTIDDHGSYLYNNGPVSRLTTRTERPAAYTVTETQRYGWTRRQWWPEPPGAPDNIGVAVDAELRGQPGPKGRQGDRREQDVRRSPRRSVLRRPRGDLRPRRPAAVERAHVVPLPTEQGRDDLAGYNVHSIAIQIPSRRLRPGGDPVLGVWATTQRQSVTGEHQGPEVGQGPLGPGLAPGQPARQRGGRATGEEG